jgi:hypothetical protein
MTGANYSEQPLIENLPQAIYDSLVNAILELEKPFEEEKSEEFTTKINYIIQDSQWDGVLKKEGHYHFDEVFLDQLKLKVDDSKLLAGLRTMCVINRVTYRPCPS